MLEGKEYGRRDSESIEKNLCKYIVTCYCIYEIQNLKKDKISAKFFHCAFRSYRYDKKNTPGGR
jgi:hypothetical protein